MRSPGARRLAEAVGLGGLAILILLPAVWPGAINRLEENREREARRLGRAIAESSGAVFLVTFDEPEVREWISGAACPAPGTEAVEGRRGRGRSFDGRPRTFLETPVRWGRAGSDFTVSLWVKLDPNSDTQDLMFRSGEELQTGFRLEGGTLRFDVPSPGGGSPALECPFDGYGGFVHLAAVVSGSEGRAVLYLNGVPRDEAAVGEVDTPGEPIGFGTRQWWAVRHPVRGVIDEAVVWNRALTPEEIRRLHGTRRGILRHLSPAADYYRWRAAGLLADAGSGAARIPDAVLDRAGSLLARGRRNRLDRLDLYLSADDRRFFAAAHRESLRSGRRINRAANPREICFGSRGRVRRGLLQLHGSDTSYPGSPRPSYILEPADGEAVLGSRRLLLSPPESASFLLALAERELAASVGAPNVAGGLVNLAVNGRARGVYHFEDREKLGVNPGDFTEVFAGPRRRNDWRSLFRWSEPSPASGAGDGREAGGAASPRRSWNRRLPLDEASLREVFDRVSRRWRAVLMNDPASPLLRAERARRMEEERGRLAEIWPAAPDEWPASRKAAEFLSEYLVVGENPSPIRITGDLDLGGFRPPGVTVRWTSSRPEVISEAGRVTRPAGVRPVEVRMTAAIDDGGEIREKTLVFRVMPETVEVPSLFVYARQPVQKTRRVDARIDYYPPGEGVEPRTLWATQRERGGVSFRGNTSYWRLKKLLSLETDTPHRILDDGGARHLQFINPRTDPTFLRNRLSFDIFRSFGSEGNPRFAPRVGWAEVFLNGAYHGLYEICERVDERMLGGETGGPEEGPSPLVYKHETVPPRVPDMRQKRPSLRRGLFMEPYLELRDFLTGSETGEFAAGFARRFDLANAVDFHLLLNLTQNLNGYPFYFPAHDILARGARPDDPFFNVPWDFDNTFSPRQEWSWMANGMQRRLEGELPGYRDRLRERWARLRRDVLVADRLVESVTEHAGPLGNYVPWDYRRWNYLTGRSYHQIVGQLISSLRENLNRMDAHLGAGEGPKPD